MKEIASILDLSEKTVEFHKHHVMEAFNVRSNADLVLFALKRGLITADPRPASSCRFLIANDLTDPASINPWLLGISPVAISRTLL